MVLMYAVESGQASTAALLLQSGADEGFKMKIEKLLRI